MYLCDFPFQKLATLSENNLILPALIPQTALLGHWSDNVNHDEPIIKYFLQIFKLYVYNSIEKTSSKHNGPTYRLKKNTKDRIQFIFQQWKKKIKMHINKWCLTQLPVEKN